MEIALVFLVGPAGFKSEGEFISLIAQSRR
jgi:hypothetical protein